MTRLFGESSEGSLGMPWLVKAEYSVREPERLWLLVVGPDVDDIESERADSVGERVGSMARCCVSLGWSVKRQANETQDTRESARDRGQRLAVGSGTGGVSSARRKLARTRRSAEFKQWALSKLSGR